MASEDAIPEEQQVQQALLAGHCFMEKVRAFCESFSIDDKGNLKPGSDMMMQSGETPEQFIRRNDVQSQLGAYAIFYAMAEAGRIDPDTPTEQVVGAINAKCDAGAINRLLFGDKNKGELLSGTGISTKDLPILARSMEIVEEIKAEAAKAKKGGKGSRKTKKKGRKGRKSRKYRQTGGNLNALFLRILCNALTLALFYYSAVYASKGAVAAGFGPISLTGMSSALANILIQGNLIRSACSDSFSIGLNLASSFFGGQTCEAIALENEVNLGNLTTYIASVLGVGVGALGLRTYDEVYEMVCRIVKSIGNWCGRTS